MIFLIAGILYFYLLGEWVLPQGIGQDKQSVRDAIWKTYELPKDIYEFDITENSQLCGKSIEEIEIWKNIL